MAVFSHSSPSFKVHTAPALSNTRAAFKYSSRKQVEVNGLLEAAAAAALEDFLSDCLPFFPTLAAAAAVGNCPISSNIPPNDCERNST